MGMIRVSDEVEGRLKEVADGRSMNAVIEKMLAYCSSPAGFCPAQQEKGAANYESLLKHFDEKFAYLESLIEDTTVDRLDGSGGPKLSKIYTNLCWDGCMQDVYFDFPETDPIWLPGVYQGWAESNMMDEAKFLIKDDVIWVEFFGTQTPALRITPALRSYLKEKGFEV